MDTRIPGRFDIKFLCQRPVFVMTAGHEHAMVPDQPTSLVAVPTGGIGHIKTVGFEETNH